MLDGIPGGNDRGAEAMAQQCHGFGNAAVIAFLFEGRVNQHQAAFFGKGGKGAQRFPGITLMHRNLRISLEMRPKFCMIFRVQLHRHQPILRAQRGTDQRWGARVAGRKARLFQCFQEGCQRGGSAIRETKRAARGFTCARRFRCCKVVDPAARMRIQHGKGRWLTLQRSQQGNEQGMLQAIRVIAGMKGVTVIHRRA